MARFSQSKKATLRVVIQIISLILVGLFLGYNLYLWNRQSLRGDTLPMPMGVGAAVVLSGSMEPELSVDDLIIVMAQKEYAVGDVVVYRKETSVVVHRIIRFEDGMVVAKGDANNAEDDAVPLDAIKGRVIFHLDGFGHVVRILKTPLVYISLMGVAFYLIELSFRKDKKKETDELEKLEEEIRRLKQQQEE